jgi:hypothetical protein
LESPEENIEIKGFPKKVKIMLNRKIRIKEAPIEETKYRIKIENQ